MNWLESLAFLMGGVTVLLLLGIPVAIAFLALNIFGAFLFMGGTAGLDQIARNTMLSVSSFSLTPIPLFANGRGTVPVGPGFQGNRGH